MAGWASNNQKLNSRGIDMVSQKVGIDDLLQNCDLPPPNKVFSGSDKVVLSSMNRICSMMGRDDVKDPEEVHVERSGGEDEKLEVLKALRLSQTRAREAEKKAASLVKERDCLSNALSEESLKLFAFRQWVRLLELHVSKLKSEWQQQESNGARGLSKEGDDDGDAEGVTWFVALAVCIGIAGVGFAFGCRYLF